MGDDAIYTVFSHFCYVVVFGGLTDPVVPTLSGASGDVVTAYSYWDAKGVRIPMFLTGITQSAHCQYFVL